MPRSLHWSVMNWELDRPFETTNGLKVEIRPRGVDAPEASRRARFDKLSARGKDDGMREVVDGSSRSRSHMSTPMRLSSTTASCWLIPDCPAGPTRW